MHVKWGDGGDLTWSVPDDADVAYGVEPRGQGHTCACAGLHSMHSHSLPGGTLDHWPWRPYARPSPMPDPAQRAAVRSEHCDGSVGVLAGVPTR